MDRSAAAGYSYTRQLSESKGDIRFSGPDVGSRNDANVVQSVPKTTPVKRYVVIDASQRNWTKQPNPYSDLIYSFGRQSLAAYPARVYTNNTFIPTFGSGTKGGPLNTDPGVLNDAGWWLGDIFYPPYNSSLPPGDIIGIDTGYIIQPSGLGFGSAFIASNVHSIRLVRALLPQRQFLSVPILVNSNASTYDISNYGATGVVQSALGSNAYSTFGTYPYLLLKLNEYPGKYVGGNSVMQDAFSVMTQRTRSQTNFQLDVGVQHYDYEPWGEEALVFQSPITTLLPLKISVTDPNGNAFVQNDALSITHIQTDSNALFLRCFTGSAQYFNNNELRVGDRVIFDVATLNNIVKAVEIANNTDKKMLLLALGKTSFPVVKLLDYVTDETGLFVPRESVSQPRTQSYNASFNGFLIPNFLNTDQYGSVTATYPGAADVGNFDIVQFPVLYNVDPMLSVLNLPFLNTSLQPTYTLELVCLEPDVSQLGGKITQ